MENGSLAAVGLYAEPPLSPVAGPATGATVVPVQTPRAEPPAPEPSKTPSLERMLLKFGLVSQEQLSEAMVEERTTGRPLWEIVQERGWVSREDLVRLAGQTVQAPPTSAPEPVPVQAPAPEAVAPAAAEAPSPLAATAGRAETAYRVLVRLSNGERIEARACEDAAAARAHAEELVRGLVAASDSWPYFGGRFVRPESIVSIDVEATV